MLYPWRLPADWYATVRAAGSGKRTVDVKRVLAVETRAHREFVDITERVQELVRAAGVREGRCVLFVPHTTAGLTINENDDPDVPRDMLTGLTDLLGDESRFRHYEGNAGGHLLSSLLGVSLTIFIADGELALGRWQAIYFGEFDGPRQREVWVRIVSED